jgi:hypothetical protein
MKSWKGSDLVRSHLFTHVLVTICPNKPTLTEIIGKLKQSWLYPRIHLYYGTDVKTGQKVQKKQELPSFKALGRDSFCCLLFYETRLLYQLLLKHLI